MAETRSNPEPRIGQQWRSVRHGASPFRIEAVQKRTGFATVEYAHGTRRDVLLSRLADPKRYVMLDDAPDSEHEVVENSELHSELREAVEAALADRTRESNARAFERELYEEPSIARPERRMSWHYQVRGPDNKIIMAIVVNDGPPDRLQLTAFRNGIGTVATAIMELSGDGTPIFGPYRETSTSGVTGEPEDVQIARRWAHQLAEYGSGVGQQSEDVVVSFRDDPDVALAFVRMFHPSSDSLMDRETGRYRSSLRPHHRTSQRTYDAFKAGWEAALQSVAASVMDNDDDHPYDCMCVPCLTARGSLMAGQLQTVQDPYGQRAQQESSHGVSIDCSTCEGSGTVPWAPGQHRNSDEEEQPCPDCVAVRPRSESRSEHVVADSDDPYPVLPPTCADCAASDVFFCPKCAEIIDDIRAWQERHYRPATAPPEPTQEQLDRLSTTEPQPYKGHPDVEADWAGVGQDFEPEREHEVAGSDTTVEVIERAWDALESRQGPKGPTRALRTALGAFTSVEDPSLETWVESPDVPMPEPQVQDRLTMPATATTGVTGEEPPLSPEEEQELGARVNDEVVSAEKLCRLKKLLSRRMATPMSRESYGTTRVGSSRT